MSNLVAAQPIEALRFLEAVCQFFQPTRVRLQFSDDGRGIHRIGKSVTSFGLCV